jgi:iron complex outermembrane receptor protein
VEAFSFLEFQREFSCFIQLVSFSWTKGETMLELAFAVTARILSRYFSLSFARFESTSSGRQAHGLRVDKTRVTSAGRDCLVKALRLACTVCAAGAASCAFSQSTAPTDTTQTPARTMQRVTTTVIVHGEVKDEYLPDAVTVGTLDGETLKDLPLSATVVTRDLLNDQAARLLSDVVKNDASVDDDYVPVGYYGWYEIRGFAIDLATGLEINGMTIAGEQDVPLENKERVEILKGIAGVESGVANAGGLIDFVTKRPAAVKAVDLATDHRGSTYGAVDLGSFFGRKKQAGVRLNLAGERISSYMNDTNGWRAAGAAAADWRLSPKAVWKGDFEYQHKVERDGSGYQLLGGNSLPNIDNIYRSTMLGDQSWDPPDIYNTFNTSTRLDYALSANWAAFAAASYSHSLIEDNVIYAYGTSMAYDSSDGAYDTPNCPNASNAPAYFFCPDGSYGIYDYRNPGELRKDEQAEAILTGHVKTGPVTHDVAAGGEIFLRSVQQPGFYTFANPYSPDGIVQDGAVYTYVGSENIYQPMTALPIESPQQSAGPRRLWEDSHQAAAILQDRIHLPGRIQLIAGGRYDSLRDHNYSLAATTPCTVTSAPGPASDPCPTTYDSSNNPVYSVPTLPSNTDKSIWLPSYAVTYNPISDLTLYGNYAELLSLGPQAGWWVENASQFLDPYHTRQVEIGAKYEPGLRILLTTALFRMRAPFFYPESDGSGGFNFVSQGRETHDGIELNAEGKAANWLRLTASATAMNATADGTGTPSYDGKQVINVPHLHTTVFADLTVPHVNGLHLLPGWSYTGRKEATRDDSISVPSYNLFNLGARYTPGGEQGRVTFRLYANNIGDKRYWGDTGTNSGDSFLWLGAPTTVRLSAHYTF